MLRSSRSIILDLNFLDLKKKKKEIRIELSIQTWCISTVVRYQRGNSTQFYSSLAISITEAITKCPVGWPIFAVHRHLHRFRASVPSSVSRNSFHSVSTRYFCNATEILRDAGISARTEQGGPSRRVEIIDKSTYRDVSSNLVFYEFYEYNFYECGNELELHMCVKKK